MRQLARDSQKDITRLSQLQQQVANLTNLTMGNVEDIDKQFSMRQTVLTDNSQNRQLMNLQYEIEKYQNEIKLLKLKLQFKHQLISYKQMKKARNQKQAADLQTEPCSIF